MTWIANNVGVVIALVTFGVAIVTGWVKYGSDINYLKQARESYKKELDQLRIDFQIHQNDTTLHIDPNRDKRTWDEFIGEMRREFRRLDEKVDKLMLIHPTPIV